MTRYRSDGRSVVYTGDTGPTDALTDLAARADVLIAEATIGPNEDPWVFHMTASEAGEAAAAAAVGKLVLTHLPPTLDKAQAQALAAKAFGGEVVVAAPGMRLVI